MSNNETDRFLLLITTNTTSLFQLRTGSIKLLAGRIKAKVAKYGGAINQVTDILRGSLVLESAGQLGAALGFLFSDYRDSIVWVKNRLGDSAAIHGYRDVLLLLNVYGHLCELQLHLRPLYEARENGHAAYAIARLIEGDATAEAALAAEDKGNGNLAAAEATTGGGDRGAMIPP